MASMAIAYGVENKGENFPEKYSCKDTRDGPKDTGKTRLLVLVGRRRWADRKESG